MFSPAVEALRPAPVHALHVESYFPAAQLPWKLWEEAATKMLGVVAQSARLATLPQRLGAAIQEAKTIERTGKIQPIINAASNFTLKATHIDGRLVPVDRDFGHISPTCDFWRFSRPEHADKPDVGLLSPYSGSHAMIMAPFAAKLLPHRNVVVIGWHDARNLKAGIRFDVPIQAKDTIEAAKLFGKSRSYRGIDLVAPSQAGIPASLAAGSTEAIRELFLVGCPENTAPQINIFDIMDHPLHWMAQYPFLDKSLFTDAGMGREGHGRKFVSQQVMHALYGCTSDKLTMDCPRQGLCIEHVEQMHGWIFKGNKLAKGQIELDNHLVDLSSYGQGLTTIAAANDGIVPPYFTHRAHEMFQGVPKGRRHAFTVPGGHYHLVEPGPTLDQIAKIILKVSGSAPHP